MKSIIFKDWEVRALMEGRKTQARRIVKKQPYDVSPKENKSNNQQIIWDGSDDSYSILARGTTNQLCPYGKPGEIIYVKETWVTAGDRKNGKVKDVQYRADERDEGVCWFLAATMPEWASRFRLKIEEIQVERLQDVTEEGAVGEGCDGKCPVGSIPAYNKSPLVYHFAYGWAEKYGWDSWEKNPYVWVIAFKLLNNE